MHLEDNNHVIYFFSSIGRVNPELFALAAGTWNLEGELSEQWLHNYANVLCVNAWQVLINPLFSLSLYTLIIYFHVPY